MTVETFSHKDGHASSMDGVPLHIVFPRLRLRIHRFQVTESKPDSHGKSNAFKGSEPVPQISKSISSLTLEVSAMTLA